MPATYEPIASTTLSSSNTTVTFSSIPSTYTDLRIVAFIKCDNTSCLVGLRFNNSSGSATTYSTNFLEGDGQGGVAATNDSSSNYADMGRSNSSTSYTSSHYADVINYASGSVFKSVLISSSPNARSGTVRLMTNNAIWRDTTAINRVDILIIGSGQFISGSTFTIYGIKAA